MSTLAATAASLTQLPPLRYADRLGLPNIVRVDVSFEEYLEFAEQCDYRVEYSQRQLVSMSQPTDTHEFLVANAIFLLKAVLRGKGAYKVYGSNLGIFIQETMAHYKPDVSLILGEPERVFHKVNKRTLHSVANLYGVVEVFSKGTMDYDIFEKLPSYKKCPTMRYAIFIDQYQHFVSVFTRSEDNPKLWLNMDYYDLEDSFQLDGHTIRLKDLYEDINLEVAMPKPSKGSGKVSE
jgi:Uma2 family endonuclease